MKYYYWVSYAYTLKRNGTHGFASDEISTSRPFRGTELRTLHNVVLNNLKKRHPKVTEVAILSVMLIEKVEDVIDDTSKLGSVENELPDVHQDTDGAQPGEVVGQSA